MKFIILKNQWQMSRMGGLANQHFPSPAASGSTYAITSIILGKHCSQ
jgi:hypothetical protein